MFVTIFKTITSVLLVALLCILIQHREIMDGTISIKKKTTNVIPSVTLKRQESTSTEKLPTKDLVVATPVVSETPTLETSQKPLSKESITPVTQAVYVTMQEGHSDTDETYKPKISPCTTTMGYRIGTFDTHFGISQDSFIDEINKAQSLWGRELDKTLFTYNEKGPLTINLIYDERQARTEDVNNLALEIQNAKDTAESLKNTYEKEKEIYLGDGDQLTKDTEAFQVRYKVYTDKVTMYNSQGGAPRAEYDAMTEELALLKLLSKDLQARRDTLLAYMETINAKVVRYNELVIYINGLITTSNSLGAKKFTEGKFNPNTNTIDIYQYNDLIKLRRVITHELGHVIGINHTNNAHSIMYAFNSGTSTLLSIDDVNALMAICSK